MTKRSDPARAKRYLAALDTTCDYFLGCNALNMTWVTGLGPRHPSQVFHMDAWYNGKGQFHPGIIPYGPWRKGKDEGQGPWDVDWPNKTRLPVHRRLAGQRALVRQPLLAHEQRVHHPPEHRPGRGDLRDPLRPGAGRT